MKKLMIAAAATAAFAAPASAVVFDIADFGNPVFTYAQYEGGNSFTTFANPCSLGFGCIAGPEGVGNSQVVYDAGSALVAHPGVNGTTAILFTAPRSTTYTFNGSAALADGGPPGTNGVGVLGYSDPGLTFATPGLTPPVGGSTASQSFTGSFFLTQGQRVGIIFSNNGSNNNDSVLVSGFVSGAIPEPATWAMMIMGFGLIGAAMRRRVKPRVNFSFA